MSRLVVPLRCFGSGGADKVSTHSVELDAGSTDLQITGYKDAILGITNALNNQVLVIDEIPKDAATVGAVPPTALRGKKWRCRYQDNVDGSVAIVSVAGADETLLTDSPSLDLSAGAGAAFKAAFEQVVVSKPQPGTQVGGGNPVTLLSVTLGTESD